MSGTSLGRRLTLAKNFKKEITIMPLFMLLRAGRRAAVLRRAYRGPDNQLGGRYPGRYPAVLYGAQRAKNENYGCGSRPPASSWLRATHGAWV
jgi:hypothetical protein